MTRLKEAIESLYEHLKDVNQNIDLVHGISYDGVHAFLNRSQSDAGEPSPT